MRIVVVGSGAAGSLVVTSLARRLAAPGSGGPVEVVLVDPAAGPVRGAAFGTLDRRHLLNVPAAGMSYDPDDRFDFVHWCVDQGLIVDDNEGTYWFAPRLEWARYLRQRFDRDVARAGDKLSVRQVHARATGVDRRGRGVVVTTETGEEIVADQTVLAVGLPAVGEDWAPHGTPESPRYVADPWVADSFAAVLQGEKDVVVVGAGLTMVDVALSVLASHPERRVVAVSRTGAVPKAHAPEYLGEVVPNVTSWGSTIAEINAAARAHVSAVAQLQGNWRPGIDGIRYRVAEVWGRLDDDQKGIFLRDVLRSWNVRRHRMAPTSAEVVEDALASGRLEVRAMTVADVAFGTDQVTVTGEDGSTVTGGWLVNCTGPREDVRTLGNQVIDSVLGLDGSQALGATDVHGLGVRTLNGQLLDPAGQAVPVWTLGALRRGELWESTAVPEIRQQAQDLARSLLAYEETVARRTA
ncbi:MAG: FAD/NAD(P)-binding protein [Nocardioides sp.]|uniref:FAD/NAD(P)-binding protein n=1 Tax=Nocardioides sp. TaxID=35761 RepID=UPI003F119C06